MSNLRRLGNKDSAILSDALRRYHENEESRGRPVLTDGQRSAFDQLVEHEVATKVSAQTGADTGVPPFKSDPKVTGEFLTPVDMSDETVLLRKLIELTNQFGGDAVRAALDKLSPVGDAETDLIEGSPVDPEGEVLPDDMGPASLFDDQRFDHESYPPLSKPTVP